MSIDLAKCDISQCERLIHELAELVISGHAPFHPLFLGKGISILILNLCSRKIEEIVLKIEIALEKRKDNSEGYSLYILPLAKSIFFLALLFLFSSFSLN